VIGGYWSEAVSAAREVFMDNKTIFLITGAPDDELIDDVKENYTRYKYLFRAAPVNLTTNAKALWNFTRYILESKLRHLFGGEGVPDEQVRVAVVSENLTIWDEMHENMTNPAIYPNVLGPYANVTYSTRVSANQTDFSNVLGNVSANGTRLLIHLFSTQAGINFTEQWAESGVEALPVGINLEAQNMEFWEQTERKCEYETILAPSGTRTPLSAKALTFYDETLSQYGHPPIYTSWGAYDAIYTLKEAIENAGTTDSDAVVTELEQTDRISTLGKFKFTEYHDVFSNETGADWTDGYVRPLVVQWQKKARTKKARLEVVWPKDQVYSRKWRIPTWIYSLAKTDFNYDGLVDIDDIFMLVPAFGARAGVPRWNVEFDIDGNGIINMVDVARFGKDFGKNASILSSSTAGASVQMTSSIPAIAQTDSTTMVYLGPPTINGTEIGVNGTVTVYLKISDAVNVTTWEAGIDFNATLLNCIDVDLGEFLEFPLPAMLLDSVGYINNTSGEITNIGRSVMGNYTQSGDGTLAEITFKVKEPGVSDLHIHDVIVIDYWGAENSTMAPFNMIDVYTVTHSAAQTVFIVSNSTGDDDVEYVWYSGGFYNHAFSHPDKELSFNVEGPYPGWSNVTIPKTLIPVNDTDELLVIIDDEPLKTENRTVTENITHYFIYFNYTRRIHNISILKRPPVYNINRNRYHAAIQEAINAPETLVGHTLLTYAGTLYEHVVVNKSVTLVGENKHNTIIDGSGTGTVIKVTANNVDISNLTIQNSGNPEFGILVDGSSGNNISHNILANNHIGIYLNNSSGNTLINNTMFDNEFNFGLYGEAEAHFDNAIDESNTVDGKPVYYIKNALNTVYSGTNAGTVYLIDCNNVTISNLTLTKNVHGIFLWNTTNSKIHNITASNNLNGISLHSSNNNTVYHNSFIGNTVQANVTASNNTAWDNGYPSGGNYWSDHSIEYPFVVDEYKGANQDVQGNDGIIDEPKVIDGGNQDNYPLVSPLAPPVYNLNTYLGYTKIQEAIDATETSEGHTIFVRAGIGTYSENVTINKSLTLIGIIGNTSINGTGTVVTITANDVTLRGFTIQGSGSTDKGILLSYANNTVISENTITKKGYGIWLDQSYNCNIGGNTLTNNTQGIRLEFSDSALISRNTLTNNSFGIVLSYSSYNNIRRNNITDNTWGISLSSASDNMMYHNNFINNTNQVYSEGSVNQWDDDYPSGGNYWSDYLGVDNFNGTHQNETGSDGIGDTPYDIPDTGQQDKYPLVTPRAPQHDVALVSVTRNKNVTRQGYRVNITMTVENQGDYTEKFNVIVYANTTIIQTITITLASESSIPIIFTWNTTGVAKGSYNITVNATAVPGENDTADNTRVFWWIVVTILGDVNGDEVVNILDIKLVKLAYSGYKPPDLIIPVLNADLDDNGKINILDLKLVKLAYSGLI